MTVEAVFALAGDELLFGELVTDTGSLSLELERVVPAGDQLLPYVWASGETVDTFADRALEGDGVDSVRLLDKSNERSLFRIEWNRDTEQFVSGILDTGGTVIEARGATDWVFRIRFETSADLTAFRNHCRDHGIDCDLQHVQNRSTGTTVGHELGLTDAQREALTVAVDAGYFEIPREVTFAELAPELDISPQAVSDRVRRGVKKVMTDAVTRGI